MMKDHQLAHSNLFKYKILTHSLNVSFQETIWKYILPYVVNYAQGPMRECAIDIQKSYVPVSRLHHSMFRMQQLAMVARRTLLAFEEGAVA